MNAFYYVCDTFTKSADPRSKSWALMGCPVPVTLILIVYVSFSKIIGPRWMESKKPFVVVPFLRVHNACLVVVNAVFVVTLLRLSYVGGDFSLLCQGADYTRKGLPLLELSWWYFMVRIFDLADTVAFVLAKKDDHVSTLHVFHHAAVVVTMWATVNYGAVGQNVFDMVFNSCVHVVMYSYYFLTTLGPRVRPYLWWKKYLTVLQMAQLASFSIHGSIPLFMDCGFPVWMAAVSVAEPFVLFVMFYRFYGRLYRNGQRDGRQKKAVRFSDARRSRAD